MQNKPTTPWQKKALAIIAIATCIVIVIGISGGLFGTNNTPTTNSAPASSTPVDASNTDLGKSQATNTDHSASTPAPAPIPKTWQKVTELSGSTNKRSDVFTLTGADARLKYQVQGDSSASMSAYMVKDGVSLEKSGGFPEVSVDQPGSDETRLVNDPGNYYLDIHSANSSWTVTIEELK